MSRVYHQDGLTWVAADRKPGVDHPMMLLSAVLVGVPLWLLIGFLVWWLT